MRRFSKPFGGGGHIKIWIYIRILQTGKLCAVGVFIGILRKGKFGEGEHQHGALGQLRTCVDEHTHWKSYRHIHDPPQSVQAPDRLLLHRRVDELVEKIYLRHFLANSEKCVLLQQNMLVILYKLL